MERKAKVTQETVNKACDQLHNDGEAVTVSTVIATVGGSFSTVGRMVKQWKQQQAEQVAPVPAMPDSITQAMHKATTEIWAAASALAGETVDRVKAETTEAVNKAQNELKEYAAEVSRLESELEQANNNFSGSKKNLESALKKITVLESEKVALETRLSDRDGELKRSFDRNETLQAKLFDITKQQADNLKSNKK